MYSRFFSNPVCVFPPLQQGAGCGQVPLLLAPPRPLPCCWRPCSCSCWPLLVRSSTQVSTRPLVLVIVLRVWGLLLVHFNIRLRFCGCRGRLTQAAPLAFSCGLPGALCPGYAVERRALLSRDIGAELVLVTLLLLLSSLLFFFINFIIIVIANSIFLLLSLLLLISHYY